MEVFKEERSIKVKTNLPKVVWEKTLSQKLELPPSSDIAFPIVKLFPLGYGWVIFRAQEITADLNLVCDGPWGIVQIDRSTVLLFGPVSVEMPVSLVMRNSSEEPFEVILLRILFTPSSVIIKEK